MTKNNISDQLRSSGIQALENLADYCGKTEVEKARLVRRVTGESDQDHAYRMGQDYHNNGPDGINCHFTNFSKAELTAAWERGFKDAKNKTPQA